jgi:hypothetical protein
MFYLGQYVRRLLLTHPPLFWPDIPVTTQRPSDIGKLAPHNKVVKLKWSPHFSLACIHKGHTHTGLTNAEYTKQSITFDIMQCNYFKPRGYHIIQQHVKQVSRKNALENYRPV